MSEYAIVQSGGKQYRVRTGDTFRVESIPGDIGDTVELTDVRMVSLDGDVTLGNPTVEGAKVVAAIVEEVKGDKLIIQKRRRSKGYRLKKGHRQRYLRVKIDKIEA